MFPFKIKDPVLRKHLKAYFPEGPIHTRIEQVKHNSSKQEELVQVKGAKIIYANYKLLQNDFPQLSDEVLKNRNPIDFEHLKKETLINNWLIQNTAFISEPQAGQSAVNTSINIGTDTTVAYRPSTYGRAVIYDIPENLKAKYKGNVPLEEINDRGLLDVKGVGVKQGKIPTQGKHSDGLLMLEDAPIEYLNQQLIQGIFIHADTNYETLPIYGIIDLGFKVKHVLRGESPACLLIRRAHTRPTDIGGLPRYGSMQQKVQLDVEQLIRKYGFTSSNNDTLVEVWKEKGKLQVSYGNVKIDFLNDDQLKNIEEVSRFNGKKMFFEGVNVQHTGEYSYDPKSPNCQLVDFGSYRSQTVHTNPILSLVSDRLMRWGGSIFPYSEKFTELDSKIAVPAQYWGKSANLYGFNTEYRNLRQDIICQGLSKAYHDNCIDTNMLIEHLDAYLQTATLLWKDKIVHSSNPI